eukprot:CAMPEP_0198238124 /NCGR_PEP_ID=MMETSP1446-20131203/3850_1 /TAXON_ID=1461542 ORGANISM="Unidentified sp, Strain CCMP2111" /NCGR_SAMPLE_ID=MMETSP1446 /ASSEMBLY_ACC=CAM_ASM_001112 /LENGTH=49 /DNA_ID= /DNA_START= /DNA_END= /DNA_ORIENTATION=
MCLCCCCMFDLLARIPRFWIYKGRAECKRVDRPVHGGAGEGLGHREVLV